MIEDVWKHLNDCGITTKCNCTQFGLEMQSPDKSKLYIIDNKFKSLELSGFVHVSLAEQVSVNSRILIRMKHLVFLFLPC